MATKTNSANDYVIQIDGVSRPMTDEERAQYDADVAELAAAKAAAEAAKAQTAADRAAAIEHAKSLGFTDAMIAVMYPNLAAAGDVTE